MSLYGLYLSNPSRDSVLFLDIERTYAGAVQREVNFDFSWKLKKKIDIIDFLYRLAIFMSLYGLHLSNPSMDSI